MDPNPNDVASGEETRVLDDWTAPNPSGWEDEGMMVWMMYV